MPDTNNHPNTGLRTNLADPILTDDELAFVAQFVTSVEVPPSPDQPIRDIGGIPHQRQPFGTPILGGDTIIEDEVDERDYVWRPVKTWKSRFDRALISERDAQHALSLAMGAPESLTAFEVADLQAKAELARRARQNAQKDTPEMRVRDRIDEWRAGIGRADYNAARRTTRTAPNAKPSQMSEHDRNEHVRQMEREKKRRQRAAKKAATLQ